MKEGKNLFTISLIAIIAISGILYVFFILPGNQEQGVLGNVTTLSENVDSTATSTEPDGDKTQIIIEIRGAVRNPGIYKLYEASRVFEAVELAGGLSENAAEGFINQARTLADGELIYFPSEEEVSSGSYSAAAYEQQLLININSATQEELMTLPGIGESKAESIIEYRKANNGFKEIEEIMEVNGIKESAFNKIKDLITK